MSYLLLRYGFGEDLVRKLDVGLDVNSDTYHSYLLSSLAFHPDIGGRVRAIADLNDGEARLEPWVALLYFYNVVLDLFPNGPVIRTCEKGVYTLQLQSHLFSGRPLREKRNEKTASKPDFLPRKKPIPRQRLAFAA
jgi:hypothetical protein